MKPKTVPFTILALCLMGLLMPAFSANSQPDVSVDKIIEQFVAKETEFSKARQAYTYRQSIKIFEYTNSGSVRGRFELIQDVLFDKNGKRVERVVFAPPSSLQNIILTPNDMDDLRNVQPFVMTIDSAVEYQIDYLGEQQVDEIETYLFAVKPKESKKDKRYFEGQIWVDQEGLQIVKTDGKGVGRRGKDEQFPRFETYRDQIDGEYWFPIYTRADDTLAFPSGPQKIRMIVKYENYKKFTGTSTITFGEVVDEEEAEEPSQP